MWLFISFLSRLTLRDDLEETLAIVEGAGIECRVDVS